jgi:uncharacterized membrane protein
MPGRSALLGSIENFKKGGLKKARTNDRSAAIDPDSSPAGGGGSGGASGGGGMADALAGAIMRRRTLLNMDA